MNFYTFVYVYATTTQINFSIIPESSIMPFPNQYLPLQVTTILTFITIDKPNLDIVQNKILRNTL